MTRVNQMGDVAFEDDLLNPWCDTPATDAERDDIIRLLLEHLNLRAIRTNKTKHGNTEVQLVPTE